MGRDIVVTTSSTLEGWEVQKQLGVVTAHVVAGTNVFSDVFASWRDFFGGQSRSYQKQLRWINDNAIKQLKEGASSRGANAVVALKIDHDEISGDGKSMFMVTVTGTAIKADSPDDYEITDEMEFTEISKDELHELMKIEQIKNKISRMVDGGRRFDLNDDKLELLLKYKVKSVINLILQIFESDNVDTIKRRWKDKLIEICRVIDEEEVRDRLYKKLETAENRFSEKYILDVIQELNLLDFEWADRFLSSDNLDKQKVGLELLTYDKHSYSEDDLKKIENLMGLDDRFEKQTEIVEKDKMLSSKKKKMWKCMCGHENKMDVSTCESCYRDKYGFKDTETDPSEVEEILKEKASVLRNYL